MPDQKPLRDRRPLERETDFARAVVERAGRLTLEYFQTRLEVEHKADDSPVTIADRRAEELIRNEIAQHFPDDGILGEEFGERRGSSGRRWIVDPIDGTQSFIRGVPLYAVLLGLEDVDGRCVVGAMALPPLRDVLWASRGGGAFWNGAPARAGACSSLATATLLTSDAKPSHYGDKLPGYERLLRACARQRGWGDAYGYALVATGRAELMVDPLLAPWDCAAVLPIVEEAGGSFFAWDGQVTIRGGSGIGCAAGLRDEILRTIQGGGHDAEPVRG